MYVIYLFLFHTTRHLHFFVHFVVIESDQFDEVDEVDGVDGVDIDVDNDFDAEVDFEVGSDIVLAVEIDIELRLADNDDNNLELELVECLVGIFLVDFYLFAQIENLLDEESTYVEQGVPLILLINFQVSFSISSLNYEV